MSDVVARWDPNGDGVDKLEFRANVFELGLVAEASEVDELFEGLDEDGESAVRSLVSCFASMW